jgi:hypothetical protein
MATTTLDAARMTRVQRAALPLSADVTQALAEQHGVCIRPLAMRRIDTTTGRIDIVPVLCGSTREDQCAPCAEKARRLRMAQCREGWHLDTEPVTNRATPSEEHKALMAVRADLTAAYTDCKAIGDESRVSRSPSLSPNSTPNSAQPGYAADSPRSIHHPSRSSVPPGDVAMPRICLADQSTNGP